MVDDAGRPNENVQEEDSVVSVAVNQVSARGRAAPSSNLDTSNLQALSTRPGVGYRDTFIGTSQEDSQCVYRASPR
jgi:hypothetical protein